MQSGRVSVVIPLYNHESYIAEAVASVLSQGDILHELIVIDDGSRDGSARVMELLARQDRRIRFLTQANAGAHATINRGLGEAQGEFVTILNSDDAYAPGRLAKLVAVLDGDPQADIAASSIAFMDGQSRPIDNPWFGEALGRYRTRGDIATALIDANFLMTTSNFLMRRSVPERIGLFAPLRYAHDLDYALRWSAHGLKLAFVEQPLMRYRFHASNTISENHTKVRVEWALCAAMYLHLSGAAPQPGDLPRLREIQAVLATHNLTQATMFALFYLRSRGIAALDEQVLNDEALTGPMREAVA